jgi:hypothetical protein
MTHLFDPPSANPKDNQSQPQNGSDPSLSDHAQDQDAKSVLANPNFLALWGGANFFADRR